MVRTTRYSRQHLRGSSTENWIAATLAKQSEPHEFTQGRYDNCGDCGLPQSAPIHGESR